MTDLDDSLHAALSEVPESLLDRDERAVLTDALASTAVLRGIEATSKVVVFVGPSGAGRSFLFNRTVGVQASPEGVLRPTTTAIIVAGTNPPSRFTIDGVVVATPNAPPGLTFLDTPSWEHDRSSVTGALSEADLAVLVVSPRRYADASVTELWMELEDTQKVIVLNRAPGSAGARDEIVESIHGIFGTAPIVVQEGADDLGHLWSTLEDLADTSCVLARRRIMARCVSSAARFVARATTHNAWQIEAVRSTVQAAAMPVSNRESLSVHDSWIATKQSMVESVARRIRDRDDDVVRGSGTLLARRILDRLGPWDESVLDGDLDAWRDRCVNLHEAAASMRWRRTSGRQLIERLSWKSAINDDVVQSKRFLRIMGKEFPTVAGAVREELFILLEGSIEERRVRWLDVLAELGEYRPGVLTTLADSLDDEYRSDG